ncbi:hypothetical protein RJ639_022572 [Escallonia herrerae]|uniref:Transposase (putative) gypsy type domain-containing protein n=1 Tax=Escallonia herrerae TaxID=1293975 RepID=A0AA88V944_9ASTE|nr:hypothetical protein RJ639_022572 [Escallonia herrerae]
MSAEDLLELIWEYPLPEGWYARVPGLQEPANYGTKFKMRIYKEQVKSGYRLPLHPFAFRFLEHYHMAPGQRVPNGWRKLIGLIYLVQTSSYKPNATDFMRVFFEICFVEGVANGPGWYYIHSKQRLLKGGPKSNKEQNLEWARIIPRMPVPAEALIPPPPPATFSMSPAESVPLEMASGSGKSPQRGFLGVLKKAKGKRKEKQPSVELPPALKKTRKRLERGKRRTAEEEKKVEEARDQGIHDFLDGNTGEKWLKKRMDDGLEIYEMGFMKAKEMFDEHFPNIPLGDFVMPAVASPFRETAMPSEAGDAAASHPPEEGPSGNAPEP